MKDMLAEAAKLDVDTRAYAAALRDWARNGKSSRYALPPDEVVRRSQPRPIEVSLAAANFELGQHLHRTGRVDDARPFFRTAHRLQPENWTYKRQAWSMVDPLQVRPSTTTAIGSATCARSARRTTTRSWRCDRSGRREHDRAHVRDRALHPVFEAVRG
jgi:hypothetical protein